MDLNQITLPAIDVAESVTFYRGLGFSQIVDSEHYSRFTCPRGTATFSIHLTKKKAPIDSGAVIYFEAESVLELDQFVEKSVLQGYVFSKMPTDERWLWREARLRDPSSNEICFYFAGNNRIDPPWKVVPDGRS